MCTKFLKNMKYFMLALILFSGILFQNVLSEKYQSPEQLLEEERLNLDNEVYNRENHVLEHQLPNNAACKCENGNCVNDICTCLPGFGNYSRNKCKACDCGPDSNCIFTSYYSDRAKVCLCNAGYGDLKGKCTDCECGQGSNCTFTSVIFSGIKKECHCKPGYRDENGKCVVSPCKSNPCKNGGNCTDSGDTFTCACVKPYRGQTCEISPCDRQPCQNGGTCIVGTSSYRCICPKPFTGASCKIGPCFSNPCQNNGACIVEGESYRCQCEKPFSGTNCETEISSTSIPARPITIPSTISTSVTESTKEITYKSTSISEENKSSITSPHHSSTSSLSSVSTKESPSTSITTTPITIPPTISTSKETTSKSTSITEENKFSTTTSYVSSTSSVIVASTENPDCQCGPFSYSCYLDSAGNTVCNCFIGYSQLGELCAECNCGPYGTCGFEYGRKKCNCKSFAVEMNGVCLDGRTTSSEGTTNSIEMSTIVSSTMQDCYCGIFSYSCSLDSAGLKVCRCFYGHSQLGELCAECNCGPYGTCSFEYGQKRCNCKSFAFEMNGVCLDGRTTSSEVTTNSIEMSTIVSSTMQECDCGPRGRCSFSFGQRKCICDPFTSEKNGKCVGCDCGENSNSCHFNWKGDKVCSCNSGYVELHGFCQECNCGVNTHSCFYRRNGTKVCDCYFGYTQLNGYCSAICREDKCVHGKCETVGNGFKCRCDEEFTGRRCEEKIQIKSNKQDILQVLQLSLVFAIFVLLFGMLCFLNKRPKM